ncbi:MAG: anhydro-N-acetylmuramic acid kinase [Arenicella sp.]
MQGVFMTNSKRIIGLMSGTSLDGLDICCADFSFDSGEYSYNIVATQTFNYPQDWVEKLRFAVNSNVEEVAQMEIDFAILMSKLTNIFILEKGLKDSIDFVCSHGHTIFHQPENNITVQVGDGQILSDELGLKVINNFRIGDVNLGGQGAPLVPIGDKLLFSEYQACLNLGGISNISFENDGDRIAFDIAPANIPLNYLMNERFKLNYDKNGEMASSGKIIQSLYDELNQLSYFEKTPPKSIGFEWIEQNVFALLQRYKEEPIANVLHTIVKQETFQINETCKEFNLSSVLITGGGINNLFFMECLRKDTTTVFVVPDEELVDFKEALIFGFLGFLKDRGEVNILSSVTGATSDSCGGKTYIPST